MDISVGPASNWRRTLAAAAISIIVTVVGGTVVSRISSREPRLTYTAPESLPFNGEGKNVGIYQLEIANEGDNVAEGVTSSVRIPMATIDNHRVTSPGALPIETNVEGDTVRLSAPSLNPTETIHLSILASSSTTLPGEPEVSVRAKGVTGVRRALGTSRTVPVSFFSTLVIATAAVIVMLCLQLIFRRGRKSGSVPEGGWRNVANVFWLGHDLLWTAQGATTSPREGILHGLRHCKHHAGQIGLANTDAYREMDILESTARKLTDRDLNPQWRAGFSAKVNELLATFGRLAASQQPGFEPGPR